MKSVKNFLLVSFLCLGWLSCNAQNLRLFHIERNKNNSLVCYDLQIKNQTINSKKPIDAYWEMPDKNNARNTLNWIQTKLAYGFDIHKIENDRVRFKLKAYPKRAVEVVYDSQKQIANAYTTINGTSAILKKLYIYATPPAYNSVEYIILFGYDPKTGQEVSEKIINT